MSRQCEQALQRSASVRDRVQAVLAESTAACGGDTLTPQEGTWPPAVAQPVLLHCCAGHSATPERSRAASADTGLMSHLTETRDVEEQGGDGLLWLFHA